MSDLIYREQAIAEMHLAFGAKPAVHAQAVNILNGMPSAEKTGKWLDMGKFTDIDGNHHEVWKCDCCGYISHDDSNYCPRCGARMEE